MGKWSNLRGVLPPAPGESPEWMSKVRTRKDELRETLGDRLNLISLTAAYNDARDEKESIADREKALNIDLEALQQLIIAELEASGSDIWRGNGFSFSEKPEPYAQTENKLAVVEHFLPLSLIEGAIKSGDAETAAGLLEKAKLNLAHVSIPWQTLNALVKAEAEAGELTIEGDGEQTNVRCSIPGVKVFLKSSLNRRKAGEK